MEVELGLNRPARVIGDFDVHWTERTCIFKGGRYAYLYHPDTGWLAAFACECCGTDATKELRVGDLLPDDTERGT
jgi:hypothetical protein